MLTVSNLYIYPIKSLQGISVASSLVTDRGLQYDRRWMLVDAGGSFLTQREHAQMALFRVSINADALQVTYTPNGESIHVPLHAEGDTQMVEVWSSRCRAIGYSASIDEWFSHYLGQKCSLVYMPDATKRRVDGRYARDKEITSFSDAYPFLLIGRASLDELNSRLEHKVEIERFRPNIVFSGGTPFAEDTFEHFKINAIDFYGVKLCARCVVTTIDPATAETGKEPLKTLSAYRKWNNKIYFGQNLLHFGSGNVAVGDTLEVVNTKPSRFK